MSYYSKNEPDNAYLLGAYIRFGKRVKEGIEFPSLVTLPSGKTAKQFTIVNKDELGYSKEFTDDVSNFFYLRKHGLILTFLQGFLSIPGNSHRDTSGTHLHTLIDWMTEYGMCCDFKTVGKYKLYNMIEWSGEPVPPPLSPPELIELPRLSEEDSYLYGLALYQNQQDEDGNFIITTNKYRGKRRRTPLKLRFNGIPQIEPFLIGYSGFSYDRYKKFHP